MSTRDPRIDPPRWKDAAPEGLPALSFALHAWGDEREGPERLARIRERLRVQLALPTQSAVGSSIGAVTVSKLAGNKLWLAAVVLWVGGSAVWWSGAGFVRAPRADIRAARSGVHDEHRAAEPVKMPAASMQDAPMAAAGAGPTHDSELHVSRTRRASARAMTKRSPPTAFQLQASTPETELALLRKAQALLVASPTRTLSILNMHEAAYPTGLFGQEREMLRIEAELHLGQRSDALQRARAFSQRFPSSTYRARIDSLLRGTSTKIERELSVTGDTQ